jgi:HEAT repeat protein
MQGLARDLAEAGVRDSIIYILLAVIAVFFLGTVVLSVYAIVLRGRHAIRERRRAQLVRKWQEPMLLALAEPGRSEQVHALVEKKHELRFVGFVVEYARRVRGEERAALAALARPYLHRVDARADSRREEIRARAIQTLGTLGLPEHAPRVVAGLDDPSPLVAMVAARVLAREETPEYAGEVLQRLERFEGWDRRFLASMLAAMGPEVGGTFRLGLGDQRVEPWTRALLAEACAIQRDLLAADVAERVLREAEERELRVSCLRLLAGVGRPEHAETVRKLCRSDDAIVRAQALRALGTVGGEEDVSLLLEAMHDPYVWAALYAARGARAAGGVDALERLARSDDPRAYLARYVLVEGHAA